MHKHRLMIGMRGPLVANVFNLIWSWKCVEVVEVLDVLRLVTMKITFLIFFSFQNAFLRREMSFQWVCLLVKDRIVFVRMNLCSFF